MDLDPTITEHRRAQSAAAQRRRYARRKLQVKLYKLELIAPLVQQALRITGNFDDEQLKDHQLVENELARVLESWAAQQCSSATELT